MTNKIIYGAPMAGVTDKPFRQMCRKFGNQVLFTEMVGVSSLYNHSIVTQKMMRIQDEENLIVQLVGIDIPAMIYSAKIAEDNGAIGIDINMGCPVRKLITNGSGCAFMKSIDNAVRVVEAVKNSVSLPVSVKTRLGWDNDHINILPFAQRLADCGISQITVHARTKEQGYSGKADWETVQKVKESVDIPVIVNGDIVSKETQEQALAITNADGVMIGRGLLGKPWLLNEIETGQKQSYHLTELVLEHLDKMMSYYGQAGLYASRKHLAWYAKGLVGSSDFCNQMFREDSVTIVQQLIKSFFSQTNDKEVL